MIQQGLRTGLLAAGVLIAGLAAPAFADATQGWSHTQSRVQPAPEQREAARDDVLQPPDADIDPDMTVAPPSHGGTIRVIPPPGTPGGDKKIEPR